MDLFGTRRRRAAEYVWGLLPMDVRALVAAFDDRTQARLRSGFAKLRPAFDDPTLCEEVIAGIRERLLRGLRGPTEPGAGSATDDELGAEILVVAHRVAEHVRRGDPVRAVETALAARREWGVSQPLIAPILYFSVQQALDSLLGEGQFNLPLPPEEAAEVRRLIAEGSRT